MWNKFYQRKQIANNIIFMIYLEINQNIDKRVQ